MCGENSLPGADGEVVGLQILIGGYDAVLEIGKGHLLRSVGFGFGDDGGWGVLVFRVQDIVLVTQFSSRDGASRKRHSQRNPHARLLMVKGDGERWRWRTDCVGSDCGEVLQQCLISPRDIIFSLRRIITQRLNALATRFDWVYSSSNICNDMLAYLSFRISVITMV